MCPMTFRLPSISILIFFFCLLSFVHAGIINISDKIDELKLSSHARIVLRGEGQYAELTKRWQYWKTPDIAAVVEVATADDVAETIRFANKYDIPFTAFSGGHGSTSSRAAVKNGIQIHMRKLNSVNVSPGNAYATIGGGAKVKEVRDALWDMDKWTVHGVCECPGMTSIALGGGHGFLQGRYGLVSDQIVSLDVVLANGTAIVVSDTSHPDLFWAMQGAGHNFGIVTSMEYKIYNIPNTEIGGKMWSYELFVYEATPENVKSVYRIAKELLDSGEQEDELMVYARLQRDPGSGKVVIMHHVFYNGPSTSLSSLTAPYHSLSIPLVSTDSAEGTYVDLPRWGQVDDNSIACHPSDMMPGAGIVIFPVDTKTYNLDALATMTEKFLTLQHEKAAFGGSWVMIEQYPMRAVQAADNKKAAVPWRDNVLLIAPAILYPALDMKSTPPTPNVELDREALSLGEGLRSALVEGAKETGGHYSYVNYAYGGEPVEDVYGREQLRRLRQLKKVYDPDGKFGFYSPIGLEEIGEDRDKDEL